MNKKMCYYYNRRSRDEKELPSVINKKWTTEQPRHNNHRKNFPAVIFYALIHISVPEMAWGFLLFGANPHFWLIGRRKKFPEKRTTSASHLR